VAKNSAISCHILRLQTPGEKKRLDSWVSEACKWTAVCEKLLNISNCQKNLNPNYNDISTHTGERERARARERAGDDSLYKENGKQFDGGCSKIKNGIII
jgi:hypothetical protein